MSHLFAWNQLMIMRVERKISTLSRPLQRSPLCSQTAFSDSSSCLTRRRSASFPLSI